MSVKYVKQDQKFTVDEVLWSKEELCDALVRAALVGQTEAHVDMTIDCQGDAAPEALTRDGLQNSLKAVKETAADFLDDVLGDLRRAVLARLQDANYGAIVTGIKYDLAGDITDIEVDISVS